MLQETPIAFEATLPAKSSWPLVGGGRLALEAGTYPARMRLRFADERQGKEEIDYPVLELELDAQGASWRSCNFLDPDLFCLPVMSRKGAVSAGLRFWRDTPKSWQEALRSCALLTGISDLLDSRDCFELPVGSERVTMMLKYQGPSIDVGWLAAEQRLVVRLGGMYYEVWQDDEFVKTVDRVDFGYLLDPNALLPVGKRRWHYAQWKDWYEELLKFAPFERL